MREFTTGATRDDDDTKNDYEGFLSPLVIEAFGNYMTKHRKQADGTLRDSDNWQKGYGEGDEHYNVCMKSMWRHFLAVWKWHRGWDSAEGVEESLGGLLFNVMAYWDRLLREVE